MIITGNKILFIKIAFFKLYSILKNLSAKVKYIQTGRPNVYQKLFEIFDIVPGVSLITVALFPSTDNCGVVRYEQSPAQGALYHAAMSEVINLTAYDASGNSASTTISFTLTVRKAKKKSAALSLSEAEPFEGELLAYPNPFKDKFYIEFSLAENAYVKVEIFNALGSKISQIFDGYLEAGQLNRFEYSPNMIPSQLMIYQVTINDKEFRGKVIYNR
jgi:hypothetical protein